METLDTPIVDAASTSASAKILVVNDAPDFLAFMREFLTLEGGFEVATLDQSEGVIEQATGAPPDLIILDIVFNGRHSGLDVAERLAEVAETAGIPILFCTALSARDIPGPVGERIASRGQRVLYKPFDIEELLTHVRELLQCKPLSRLSA